MVTISGKYDVQNWSDQWAGILRKEYRGINSVGVGEGLSGVALFFLYRYSQTGKKEDLLFFERVLERVLDKIQSMDERLLTIELTEFLHVLDVSDAMIPGNYDTAALKQDLLPIIRECGEALLNRGQYDPYTGGFFQAYYMLQSGRDLEFAAKCIGLLMAGTEFVSPGTGYFHSQFDKERICLSVTHGLSFYITYLCAAYAQGICKRDCLVLLNAYSNYLHEQRLPFEKYSCFFTDYENENSGSRLNLCYGDAGILLALLKASRILKNKQMEQSVLEMLEKTSERMDQQSTGIRDNSLLYGSTGLSLYYQKIFQLSGNPQYARASVKWKEISMSDTGKRMAAYYTDSAVSVSRIGRDISFQEGLTGALTLYECRNRAQMDHLQFFFYLK